MFVDVGEIEDFIATAEELAKIGDDLRHIVQDTYGADQPEAKKFLEELKAFNEQLRALK